MEDIIYEKPWNILLVQIDSLTGEAVGAAIAELYAAGASNVQVISSLTKKNRPGHLVVIDVRPEKLRQVEQAVIRSLGVSGWHCLESTHRHLATRQVLREAELCYRGERMPVSLVGKEIRGQTEIRPEVSCCLELQEQIHEKWGVFFPMRILQAELALFFRDPRRTEICLE